MTSKYAVWALITSLSALATAQQSTFGQEGPFLPGPRSAADYFESAGRDPNATSSITFIRNYNNTPEEWTWRVNITEVPWPDNDWRGDPDSATFNDGWRVTNTQWELNWPGDSDTLGEYIREQEVPIGVKILRTAVPSNVSDLYQVSDGGDCTPMLGEECVRSLQSSASSGQRLEGCDNSIGNFGPISVGIDTAPNATSTYERGETFYYWTSPAYQMSNSTQFSQEEGMLQILVLHLDPPVGFQGSIVGDASTNTNVLCRIVNAQRERGAGSDNSAGEESSAHSTVHGATTSKVLLAAVMFVVIAIAI